MKRFGTQKAYLACMVIMSIFISFLSGCGGGGGGHWNEPPGPSASIVSINVTPARASIPVTGTQQYTATAIYGDGSSQDVTATSTWTAANLPLGGAAVATVSSAVPTKGLATGNVIGQSTITASFGGLSGSATLTVTASVTSTAASCFGPGPLDLGSAASFGVLAGTAFTVTNPTSVTGDVGSPSITPAAGPSTLVGTMFDTSTGSLALIASAVSNMQAAVGCANARQCNFNYGADTDFATVVGLAPGVHCVTGAMSVGSNLNLSTPGVYIFRSSGTLTSASTITVAFTGSANAANTSVFWVPTGATSIGASNGFLGTIMSSSGAITLGATTTLIPGRVLSGAAVTLNTNTVTKPTP